MVAQLFPPRHVYFPSSPSHTSTVILLHDTNSTGAELAAALAASTTPATETATAGNSKSVFEHFPSCRWVFPSAQPRQIDTCYASRGNWIDVDVDVDAGIEADSNSDANADADSPQQTQAQTQGQPSTEDKDNENEIKDRNDDLETCVEYILQIVEEEVTRLDGDSRRVVLGGFGQGMAVAIAALLAARRRLGGFVGVSGWVPFSESVEGLGGRGQGRLAKDEARMGGSGVDGVEVDSEADSLLETPVLLSYLEDDPCVDIQTGLTAYETLNRLGFVKVARDARPGSQQGENWLLDATLLDIIVGFLAEVFGHEGSISAHDVML
jgi:predicted esterase